MLGATCIRCAAVVLGKSVVREGAYAEWAIRIGALSLNQTKKDSGSAR